MTMTNLQKYETQVSERISKTMNNEWLFTYDPSSQLDLDMKEPAYNAASWSPVAVPHTWNTYETTRQVHPFIHDASERDSTFWWYGWGWYRKSIDIGSTYVDKNVFLEFDGVQKYSKIWVNGHFAGEHKGGFTSFSIDVTEHIHFNETNVIAVGVSNRRNDHFGGIPPMTAGNWNVYGGIYRDVRIVMTDKLHVPFQGSAEHEGGTFITTPTVSDEKGTVRVRTYVKNAGQATRRYVVRSIITNEDNRVVTTMQAHQTIDAGKLQEIDQTTDPIQNPHLWSPDNPYVYHVYTQLWDDDHLIDHYESIFGFRWFHWDYEKNSLFLNGERIHLNGTNRHQEYPWLGDAIPKWMHEMDLQDIKYNQEHNFIRTCHYTQDQTVYDWADRHGLIVCEEVPNIKNIAFGDDIQEQHVREMIRRDRNHPSIMMWSMGNETNHAADGLWAREEDDSRIVHFRHVQGRGQNEPHTHEQLEMENVLRCTIRGWYNADVKDKEPEIGQHTGHEKWQHDMALIEGASQRGRLDMNGVMWIYADHGADREYVDSPLKHVNPKGWVDAYRVPKLIYYLWQAYYLKRPMIFIHPYDWTKRYLNTYRDLTVNSNCEEVELIVNNEVIDTLFPTKKNDFTVVFENVLVEKGKMKARGKKGNKYVMDEVVMASEPNQITLSTESDPIPADRSGIALIKVDILDEHGVHVYGATNDLNFTLSGPARLIGPDRYVSDINRHENMAGTMYITTPIFVPIRSTNETGTITLTVSSPGLKRASIHLSAVIPPDDVAIEDLFEPEVRANASLNTKRQKELLAQYTERKLDSDQPMVPLTQFDIDWSRKDPLTYVGEMRAFLTNYHNQVTDNGEHVFNILLDFFVQQLLNDNGIIVADDYNYTIEQFNDYLLLAHFIEQDMQTSSARKEKLKETYAKKLITLSVHIDPHEEIERIKNEEGV